MKMRDLNRGQWERISFEEMGLVDAPESPGCYVITNIYTDILYIGKTTSIRIRMKNHLGDSRMRQADNFGVSAWFYYWELPVAETYPTEQSLIAKYKFNKAVLPPLNRIGG